MTDPTNDHQPDRIAEVTALIEKIVRKSLNGNYLFRGEPDRYRNDKFKGRVSSNLYRRHIMPVRDEATGSFDETKHTYPSQDALKRFQADTIQRCKDHVVGIGNDEFEILTTLQHYGIETNLIDFTTDCHIALFFACNGSHEKVGRVVLLNRSSDLEEFIKVPTHPQSRVLAQKSVFVQPPDGFIDPDSLIEIDVPSNLKQWVLIYLLKYHNISSKTIYNDMLGFVKHRDLIRSGQGIVQVHFADFSLEERDPSIERLDSAIKMYTKGLEHYPYYYSIYVKLGKCYQKKKLHRSAIETFTKAIFLSHSNYEAYIHRGCSYFLSDIRDLARKDFMMGISRISDKDLQAKFHQYIKDSFGIDLSEEAAET